MGEADWDIIGQVVDAVGTMPVIGNGDVIDGASAARMMQQTGCAGVMVGRAMLGRPWLLQHIWHSLQTGEMLPQPSRAERARLALQHAEYTLRHTRLTEPVAVREMRGQLSRYALDEAGSVRVRNRLVRVEGMRDVRCCAAAHRAGCAARCSGQNDACSMTAASV